MKKKNSSTNSISLMRIAIPIATFLIGLGLGSMLGMSKEKASMAEELIVTTPTIEYSLEQVARHNTAEDCWQVIDGVVYDFTSYLASEEHPGGGAMIKDCGTDASETYAERPPHSDYARSLLPEYAIGNLK